MAAAILDASLLVLLATVTVTDLRSRLVPDRALLGASAVALAAVALSEPGGLLERLGCALGAGGLLLAAALSRPDSMGLGDVKLTAVLGLYLGMGVVTALLVAFAAGALAGAAIVAAGGWQARSRAIPFAPFLALGALVAV